MSFSARRSPSSCLSTEMPGASALPYDDSSQDDSTIDIVYPSGKLGAMTRRSNEIKELLPNKSSDNYDRVSSLLKELIAKRTKFVPACRQQHEVVGISQVDLNDFMLWESKHVNTINVFCDRVVKWIDEFRGIYDKAVSPDDSVSRSSACSSIASMRAKLVGRKIKVETKRKLIQETSLLKENEMKAKIAHEELQLSLLRETKELKIRYETEEINKLEQVLSGSISPSVTSRLGSTSLDLYVPKFKNVLEKQNDLALMLAKNQVLSQLPHNEPEIFDGNDITLYQSFVLSFERTIETRCEDSIDRFYYLQKYTRGRPRELVLSCNRKDATNSYSEARALLHGNYGDEFQIAHKYLERLDNWPTIASESVVALDEFVTYLTMCDNMMVNTNYLNQLNSLKEIKNIVMKLPYDLRKTFRREISTYEDKSTLTFHSLVSFVTR